MLAKIRVFMRFPGVSRFLLFQVFFGRVPQGAWFLFRKA